jgi:hypothetical protein
MSVGWAKALARHFHCNQTYLRRAHAVFLVCLDVRPRGHGAMLACVDTNALWARAFAHPTNTIC